TSTAVNIRLLCRKKKPRGSASSESVRAGLLPRADLFGIIGFVLATVNVKRIRTHTQCVKNSCLFVCGGQRASIQHWNTKRCRETTQNRGGILCISRTNTSKLVFDIDVRFSVRTTHKSTVQSWPDSMRPAMPCVGRWVQCEPGSRFRPGSDQGPRGDRAAFRSGRPCR